MPQITKTKNKKAMLESKKESKNTKYIFVVGGVISGVGKGVTTSSIGLILKSRGYKVTAVKIDPYINVDAGTMNPTEHGEVFVLGDGYETDQDMGNYERFLNVNLPSINYMTTGRVYQSVIEKERSLKYGGKCVQVIPHVPNEVIERIKKAGEADDADVVMIEIGGTVGEYENVLFLEAARMMKMKNREDVATVMVTYVPLPSKVGEMKTKPTQHAVRELNSVGIEPDIIIARSQQSLDERRKEKISMFCNIDVESIISAPDIDSIYDVPLNFEKDKLGDKLVDILKLKNKNGSNDLLKDWKKFFDKSKIKKEINIAIVGKYFDSGDFVLSDAYISVIEAIKYAAYENKVKVNIAWLNSKSFETRDVSSKLKELKSYDGVLVPGGFGESGIEGKIKVIQYVRENKIPFFGICYGMQLAVVEHARNVLNLKDAHTTEINKNTKYPVIDLQNTQKSKMDNGDYGGSMRLGNYEAHIDKSSLAYKIYKQEKTVERHRHRYEVNNDYIEKLKQKGLRVSATSKVGNLVEIVELPEKDHPYFIACQFHPEFLARPMSSHPLFTEFIKASLKNKN